MDKFDFNSFKNTSISSFIDQLLTLNGTELSVLACLLGYSLTINTTINQQSALGNFFELLGQFILTSSSQSYNLKSQTSTSNDDLQAQINELYKMFFNKQNY